MMSMSFMRMLVVVSNELVKEETRKVVKEKVPMIVAEDPSAVEGLRMMTQGTVQELVIEEVVVEVEAEVEVDSR